MIVTPDRDFESLRSIERDSIRMFVQRHADRLTGRVLDYGCGLPGTCVQPEPYRDLVAGEYVPYDLDGRPFPTGPFDAILCTQVLQYVSDPAALMRGFYHLLTDEGALVLTYPTHWPEVEASDRWRFTKRGMEWLLSSAMFSVKEHQSRWRLTLPGYGLAGGYGVVAGRTV